MQATNPSQMPAAAKQRNPRPVHGAGDDSGYMHSPARVAAHRAEAPTEPHDSGPGRMPPAPECRDDGSSAPEQVFVRDGAFGTRRTAIVASPGTLTADELLDAALHQLKLPGPPAASLARNRLFWREERGSTGQQDSCRTLTLASHALIGGVEQPS